MFCGDECESVSHTLWVYSAYRSIILSSTFAEVEGKPWR